MKTSINIVEISGLESANFIDELSSLRIQVFRDFPYLYDGTLSYEKNYLKTYLSSANSFLALCRDGEKIVGASTAIPMSEKEDSLLAPLLHAGIDPKNVCYFGESVLLEEYRGKGIGKKFMRAREKFAKSKGLNFAMFCTVLREIDHPLRPASYRPLDPFWHNEGYEKVPGLICEYSWKDLNEKTETKKSMQFWMKKLGAKNVKSNNLPH